MARGLRKGRRNPKPFGAVTAGAVVRTLGYSDSGNTASDATGGTVLTNIYDSTDRLVEVQQGAATVATYLHNAQGQRVAKTAGGATTHYVYDLGGNLIAEADGATGAASAEYVWLEGMPLAFIQGGAVYYVHSDHLNTPQRITDAAAAVVWDAAYRPFGEATTTGALTFNLRFPGQYYDVETALHYNYFRDYDPSLGRYIQSDPIGLGGGWNTYGYVDAQPVAAIDLTGLKRVPLRVEFRGEATIWFWQDKMDKQLRRLAREWTTVGVLTGDVPERCVLRQIVPAKFEHSAETGIASVTFVEILGFEFQYEPTMLQEINSECGISSSDLTCQATNRQVESVKGLYPGFTKDILDDLIDALT